MRRRRWQFREWIEQHHSRKLWIWIPEARLIIAALTELDAKYSIAKYSIEILFTIFSPGQIRRDDVYLYVGKKWADNLYGKRNRHKPWIYDVSWWIEASINIIPDKRGYASIAFAYIDFGSTTEMICDGIAMSTIAKNANQCAVDHSGFGVFFSGQMLNADWTLVTVQSYALLHDIQNYLPVFHVQLGEWLIFRSVIYPAPQLLRQRGILS